jgi:NADH-quinone oxidoreductase subunit D
MTEFKSIEQGLPFYDRLDYVCVVCNEHLVCFALESLLRCMLSLRVSSIRCCLCELVRCFNGLLCISCSMFDMGSLSPLLWAFEERDKILMFFDFLCGCRMHVAFFVVCGVLDDFSVGVFDFLFVVLFCLFFMVELFDVCVCCNRIAYCRLRGIALVDLFDVLFNSISGVVLRSCGLLVDVRLFCSYELYCVLCFNFVFCCVGDAFDRFLNRLFDIVNSLFIMKQCLLFFVFFGFGVFFYGFCSDCVIETVIYMFFMC